MEITGKLTFVALKLLSHVFNVVLPTLFLFNYTCDHTP